MKLLALEIEGYGVWSGLKLQRMSEGLNVVYGPNEAGKSTLLHFIRSALYGFSPDRRRYLPPVHGGRPGGWLEVAGAGGQFQIARYTSPDGNPRLDETLITAADGVRHNEQVMKTLLADIDEATFNNVFAVSLNEMQELATLSDTQAADVLYNITAGLDRVSLVEVTRDLETTRNQILDQHGGPSQITQLMNQREQIRRQIEEQQSHAARLRPPGRRPRRARPRTGASGRREGRTAAATRPPRPGRGGPRPLASASRVGRGIGRRWASQSRFRPTRSNAWRRSSSGRRSIRRAWSACTGIARPSAARPKN